MKRSKGASTGTASKSFLRALSLSTNDVESSDPRLKTLETDLTAESKQRDSTLYGSTVAMILDNGRHSINWGASRLNDAWASSCRHSDSSRRPSNASAAGAAESSSSSSSAPEQQPAAAKDRTSLVAALNRSLSVLTESPSVTTNAGEDYSTNFGRKRYTDPALEKRLLSPDGPGERSLSPPPLLPAKNSWRENYVMRFSGWRADNPDHGLPPSLTTPQQSSVFVPSRTVISPLAPRFSGAVDAVGREEVGSSEGSDLEHGDRSSHQQSKDPFNGKPH